MVCTPIEFEINSFLIPPERVSQGVDMKFSIRTAMSQNVREGYLATFLHVQAPGWTLMWSLVMVTNIQTF